ncbi:glycosyltransferase [Jannaschia sp. Os4]|uniref:glycosyltransferase family 2 protein n=1 Tax=Jannaschia sp. Os4 TaxID=2807617 RepID=UPI00193A8380|nr:glycosyltransferase family 2 protein [Jannaschia sp. Os4]MBM2575144.1 glycosyltransferase [Jannaschia sp. Os4]
MRLAVVIPHLDQPADLARGLAALFARSDGPDEVIVVDNGSAALPVDVVAAHPRARLISEPTPGPGPARNAGIAATGADLLAFLDADCLPRPGWAGALRAAFADGFDGILGGDVRVEPADPRRPTPVEAYEAVFAFRMDRYVARQGFTGAGNMAVRARTARRIGPFAGLGVAEDRDWGHRARAMGIETRFDPAMAVTHPARPSLGELRRKWDRHVAHDRARVVTPGARLRWVAKAAALPLSPLAALPEIATTDRLDGPRARAAALAGCTAIRWHRARRMASLALGGDPVALAARWREAAA